jgi:phosphoribosylformylglycinamidine synthase
MKAMIKVTLKKGVLDPQGKAIMGSLDSLGFDGYDNVRQGKYFELDIDAASKSDAEARVKEMCEKLLTNTVIENYEIEIG